MAECLICNESFGPTPMRRTPDVCFACRAKIEVYDTTKRAVEAAQKRIAELEAKLADQATHAAVGRAVSKIPRGAKLHQSESTEEHYWVVMDWEKCLGKGPTPLDALKAAGLTDE